MTRTSAGMASADSSKLVTDRVQPDKRAAINMPKRGSAAIKAAIRKPFTSTGLLAGSARVFCLASDE
jgi:hypothetical protein